MKALNWIAWISGIIGVVILLFGLISPLMGKSVVPGINQAINYFHMASSFFLITIALFVYLIKCQCKKD